MHVYLMGRHKRYRPLTLRRFQKMLMELLRQDEARIRPKITLPILQFQLRDPDAVLPEPKPPTRNVFYNRYHQRRESSVHQPEMRA
jgi:hypothetical protein